MLSTMRMTIAYAISLAWTVPCALAASESPRFNRILSPIAEIVGSMPATALFPIIVVFLIRVHRRNELASILLILTGMQWYLLFNLLAGINQVPEDLKEAARAFGLSRVARLAQADSAGRHALADHRQHHRVGRRMERADPVRIFRVQRSDLPGARHRRAARRRHLRKSGNGVMILLSLLSMIAVVLLLNRLMWRPLYNLATERYRLDY